MTAMLHPYVGLKESRISLVHEEDAVPFIYALIATAKFEMIVELGTSWGGFTILLHEALPDAEIHTFDNDNPREVNYAWFEKNTKNIYFYKPVDVLIDDNETVVNLLKMKKYKLLYCDNGNKPLEVERYAKYLNSGDIIGVHDYNAEYKAEEVDKHLDAFDPYYHDILEPWTSRFWRKK